MSIDEFIARWSRATGSELANAQLFVTELCTALDLPQPNPATDDTRHNDYVFERAITFEHGNGTTSAGRIDCYRRGAFVLESKKIRASSASRTYDDAMLRAHGQAQRYVRALPASESRPPFVLIVDVGNVIEIHSEFSRTGGAYIPFPDPRSYRIPLADLKHDYVRARLRAVWLEPLSLDPTRASARVTREVSAKLAIVAKSLERAGHSSEAVAGFLTRCLFSMFAEDVELLPKGSFKALIETHRANPPTLARMMAALWHDMDVGGFCAALAIDVLKFNGKLFKTPDALTLTQENIDTLLAAARADWREVEPAIFGTLLEQALGDTERHAFGAHYTPRAHVERLVLPTIITPLREDWANVQAAALLLANEGKVHTPGGAVALVRGFFQKLCTTTVLDPACGSGNFLYVTLEHLKRLEGEVLIQLDAFGFAQGRLEADNLTVDPHQLLGIEVNPRAAAIAEAVLWIGYLQWHFRTQSSAVPPQPVLRDFKNIECRDAVLAWDSVEYETDAQGRAVTRWDGRTYKLHPVTGKEIPDEAAQVAKERYVNARRAEWPAADFIIGNPPFIGAGPMRQTLGDGYVEALRNAWNDKKPEDMGVPESADFVMYWWEHAARAVRSGSTRRFGFITTNSLRQTFNRRVVEKHLHPSVTTALTSDPKAKTSAAKNLVRPEPKAKGLKTRALVTTQTPAALRLAFAIPDHPWVDNADGAAVRIAMTVGTAQPRDEDDAPLDATPGCLQTVTHESPANDDGEVAVTLSEQLGEIHADLTIGADVTDARALRGNENLCFRGVTLIGSGFWVSRDDPLARLEPAAMRPLVNGKDLTQIDRKSLVIDLFGQDEMSVRTNFPHCYQRLVEGVKPERDQSQRAAYRQRWWVFAEARPELRSAVAGIGRYIATSMTAKHRLFTFLGEDVLPDQGVVAITIADAQVLGIVSSSPHIVWAFATGGRMGVGNDSRYNQSRCFETFPFPSEDTGLTPALRERIASLAEHIDAHRKRVLAERDALAAPPAPPSPAGLTLTGLYNVLDALREGRALTAKEKAIHDAGLVAVLRSLHDELDAAVLAAYGWADLTLPRDEQTLLTRLVALNNERAAEETNGTIRYLRPAYQDPAQRGKTDAEITAQPAVEPTQTSIDMGATIDAESAQLATFKKAKARKPAWPSTLPERMKAVAGLLSTNAEPMDSEAVARAFAGKSEAKKQIPEILETLVALGRAQAVNKTEFAAA